MEMKFGKMTVTRCDKHTFLGTKLRFPGDGSVQINMREYIMEAIEVFNQPLTRSAATPAIDDLSKPLLDENMEHFVSIAMKLWWVGNAVAQTPNRLHHFYAQGCRNAQSKTGPNYNASCISYNLRSMMNVYWRQTV